MENIFIYRKNISGRRAGPVHGADDAAPAGGRGGAELLDAAAPEPRRPQPRRRGQQGHPLPAGDTRLSSSHLYQIKSISSKCSKAGVKVLVSWCQEIKLYLAV